MIRMLAVTATALSSVLIATHVLGALDPIAARQGTMNNVGEAAKLAGAMAKGELAYDPTLAVATFRIMNTAALGYGTLFPEGSQTGKTDAAPTIWSDRPGFEAALDKFTAATTAGIAANPADVAAFRTAFGAIGQTCGGCHETYRIKRP